MKKIPVALLTISLMLACVGCGAGNTDKSDVETNTIVETSDDAAETSDSASETSGRAAEISNDAEETSDRATETSDRAADADANEEEGTAMEPEAAQDAAMVAAADPETSAEESTSAGTAYGSGTVRISGEKPAEGFDFTDTVEFVYVDGVMTNAEYEWEGKGSWGGDSPNSIETQPYYGSTVEELVEKLEKMGFTVTVK